MARRIQIDFDGVTLWAEDPAQAAAIASALSRERRAGPAQAAKSQSTAATGTAPQRNGDSQLRPRLLMMLRWVKEGPIAAEDVAKRASLKSSKGLAMYSRVLREVCEEAGIAKEDALLVERGGGGKPIWKAASRLDDIIAALEGQGGKP